MVRRSPYKDEYEDEIDRRQRRSRREKRPTTSGNRRAPLLLRVLSLFGVLLLCFVAGYLGISWMMDTLNTKMLLKPENRVENQQDLEKLNATVAERARASAPGDNVQQISLNLYYTRDNKVESARQNFVARTQEDNIANALKAILTLSSVPDAEKVSVLHVFRSADTVFLDLASPFVSSLASMGQRQSLLLLTGIVRTMQENFSPIQQVRFLIDSRPPSPGGPVDLTVLWKMPSRS